MVSSGLAGLIYDRSAFRLALSCATMHEMTRWMNRENGMDGGWLCGQVETGRIGIVKGEEICLMGDCYSCNTKSTLVPPVTPVMSPVKR